MTASLDIDEDLAFSASFGNPDAAALAEGFNQYGVRENLDDEGNLRSVDVNYEAMEPGEPDNRNGVRITEEFLRNVGEKEYTGSEPFMLDHNKKTLSKAGHVRKVWFSEDAGKLMVQSRIPNTGAQTHDELIKRFTYEPPTVTNGSVGFGDSYTAIRNDDGEPQLQDGRLREFSTTPFPAGYEEGGLRASFAESAVEAAESIPQDFNLDMEDRSKIFDMWTEMMNMSEEQMDMWESHPCSDHGVDNGENHRDEFYMLMGQPMESWNEENFQIANRAIDFIATELEKDPEDPENGGPGTCPSRWAVNLLNRGYNPFDSFPSGNPQFQVETDDVTTFDDPSEEDEYGENLGSSKFSQQTIQF